ncbi:UDP-3-O-[3-hydroxymyristoyl] glucosamine N-acyltransferase [Inquilinus ginsengisoli]|uniref:UDP-3-O-[3-hydroxymyristoyl] glucosamine N-acyltransferase n=1 Tax=Inquilinus ginsengisoli TaxID=363840 RepID=A0ABU1JKU6_9PROT|nr:hypothetical protein [Inquilinus ginsengisoli]MDR6289220.1 UDP-3-O-[3-hydroxymyristoyl] glucosamine N-acyltransferase [Inquilinus ginsengisoli]
MPAVKNVRYVTKREYPTMEDALYAAEGLTADYEERLQIAAELSGVSVDEVRAVADAQAAEMAKLSTMRMTSTVRSNSGSAVVVERRRTRTVVMPRSLTLA